MKRLLLVAGITIAPAIALSQGSYLDIMGIIRGDSLGLQFGKKVISAGDVNGDTIPDFLVLATGDQKVYLFHGKKGGLDTLPDLAFVNKIQLDGLGDLNNDGGLDFAMRPSSQSSRLNINYGGACLDTVTDGFVARDSFSGPFWASVTAGRITEIGSNQVVVGYTYVGFDSTRFYFFNAASSSIDSQAFKTLDLERRVGFPAGPAGILGDINGDGYADLAIGRATGSDTVEGEVEIYFGASTFDTLPDLVLHPPSYLTGLAAGDFGELLAAVGDLNNDGLREFVIGSGGLTMLYFGGNPLDTLPRFRLDRPGRVFVNGGDINADGFNDLLVGRPQHPITGYAYVYYGGPAMDSIVDLEIKEVDLPTPASGFGQTVAGLGDIDGDGSNDFAVGSTSNTDPDRGYLWVFKGLLPSTGVEDGKIPLPRNFNLSQNYPNPFNSNTTISFLLSRRERVRLEIFNIAGQLVKVLLDQEQAAGNHRVSWEGKDSLGKLVPSGIYLYRLWAGEKTETKKMTLIR